MLEMNFYQIGQRIKSKRKELCMTQPELALKVGLSVASVSKYENGKVEDATTTKFVEFADALSVSPAYLMGWEEIATHSYDETYYLDEGDKFLSKYPPEARKEIEVFLDYIEHKYDLKK